MALSYRPRFLQIVATNQSAEWMIDQAAHAKRKTSHIGKAFTSNPAVGCIASL